MATAHRVEEPWESLGVPLLVDRPDVKCWMEVVEPGETRPVHTHRHPWVTVVLEGAAGDLLAPDGSLIQAGRSCSGDVGYHGAQELPASHCVRNTSDRRFVAVAVELRNPAPV
jgi:beta-alanine degradation protein BauB